MKKILIFSAAFLLLMAGLINFAAAQGKPSVGLLPTNPFYFLKNWAARLNIALTFNPINKAIKEAEFAEQKLQEAEAVKNIAPERTDAIQKALNNYVAAKQRLSDRIAALPSVSQNPNVEKLNQLIVEQTVRHKDIFNKLLNEESKPIISEARAVSEDNLVKAFQKDDPEKFMKKVDAIVKSALEEKSGADDISASVESTKLLVTISDQLKDDALKNQVKKQVDRKLEDLKNIATSPSVVKESLKESLSDIQDEKNLWLLKRFQEKLKESSESMSPADAVVMVWLEELGKLAEEQNPEGLQKAIEKIESEVGELGFKILETKPETGTKAGAASKPIIRDLPPGPGPGTFKRPSGGGGGGGGGGGAGGCQCSNVTFEGPVRMEKATVSLTEAGFKLLADFKIPVRITCTPDPNGLPGSHCEAQIFNKQELNLGQLYNINYYSADGKPLSVSFAKSYGLDKTTVFPRQDELKPILGFCGQSTVMEVTFTIASELPEEVLNQLIAILGGEEGSSTNYAIMQIKTDFNPVAICSGKIIPLHRPTGTLEFKVTFEDGQLHFTGTRPTSM